MWLLQGPCVPGLTGSGFYHRLSLADSACFLAHVVGYSIENWLNECVRYSHVMFLVYFSHGGEGET